MITNRITKPNILPGLQRMQRPFSFRMGSHVSGSTRIIEIGYILGISRETKPMAPNVLSILATQVNKKR